MGERLCDPPVASSKSSTRMPGFRLARSNSRFVRINLRLAQRILGVGRVDHFPSSDPNAWIAHGPASIG